jgi:hypothetical protein
VASARAGPMAPGACAGQPGARQPVAKLRAVPSRGSGARSVGQSCWASSSAKSFLMKVSALAGPSEGSRGSGPGATPCPPAPALWFRFSGPAGERPWPCGVSSSRSDGSWTFSSAFQPVEGLRAVPGTGARGPNGPRGRPPRDRRRRGRSDVSELRRQDVARSTILEMSSQRMTRGPWTLSQTACCRDLAQDPGVGAPARPGSSSRKLYLTFVRGPDAKLAHEPDGSSTVPARFST